MGLPHSFSIFSTILMLCAANPGLNCFYLKHSEVLELQRWYPLSRYLIELSRQNIKLLLDRREIQAIYDISEI